MKVFIPEISWHERDPVYTCAFHPVAQNKFATASVTGTIRLWEVTEKAQQASVSSGKNSCGLDIGFVANLKRHTKSVNVVRWNHDGLILASAGDEGVIFLWNENEIKNQKTLDNDDCESKENWFVFKTLRGHLEDILDLAWSRDGSVLISGSIDNSVIVWNVASGAKVAILKEPKGFVQGVVYDPSGNVYGALSTDRCLRIFSATSNKCIHNVNKIQLSKDSSLVKEAADSKEKELVKEVNKENSEQAQQPPPNIRIFHDDTMKSFFRRMSFSPDGNLLFAPSGCLEVGTKITHTSYIFARNCYSKPSLYIPHDRPSVAISVCPLKFELVKKVDSEQQDLFNLPYRYVYAIATEDSVYLYDTQNPTPFAYVTDIHYSNLSDLSWSMNGKFLLVTSIDGFCTFIAFKDNELGRVYAEEAVIMPDVIVESKNSSQQSEKQASQPMTLVN